MAWAILVVSALQCRCRRVICWNSDILISVWGFLLSGLGGRDARPGVARVRNVHCPVSALKCFEPGPLGDASGNFPLVLAYVKVVLLTAVGVLGAPLC